MRTVKWVENDKSMEKKFNIPENDEKERAVAFDFQTGLLCRRQVGADGKANLEIGGVWLA